MLNISYKIKSRNEKVILPDELGFGIYFTDHMFEMDYTPDKGWHNASIHPLHNFCLHPATSFIHYGQSIFEGLKAFKTVDNQIQIFRPDLHIQRLNNSARKLCMPEVDPNFVLEAMKELISIDSDWIPTKKGEALYIRPFMFGKEPVIGVRPSKDYKFIIILSPVGAYYPEGFKPVKILAQDVYVRTIRKGIGDCKTSANYVASLFAAEEAKKLGFTQVLWLDGVEQKYIEEVGTMNIFIQFNNEIATPKLTGSILPGITRQSVIQILNEWGYNVSERLISMQEVIDAYDNGKLVGIFGTGTAAIISTVGLLSFKGKNMIINSGEIGELDLKLFNELTSIHIGEKEDYRNWTVKVEKKEVVV